MEALTELVAALVAHPTECFLALTLIAFGFYYRAREADRIAVTAKNEERVQMLNDRNLETAKQVIPVAEKLADGVTTLERLMEMTKGEH